MCLIVVNGDSLEYFCNNCYQLRLSVDGDVDKCLNCGSTNLVIAKVGFLDKEALLKDRKGNKE